MNRLERLEKILNGGKGSGNFNPGQGRGVGKPSNHSINTDISKSGLTHKSGEATAGYTGTTSASIINDLLRQGLDTKDYQSVIDRLDSNMEEIKVDTLLKRGVSFNFLKANSEAFGITEDMGYKEVQKNIIGKSFKELGYSSATYGDESDYGSIHLKIKCPKGTKAIWTGNDKEKEVIISRGTTFKVNDYRRENENDAWSKIIVDLEVISQDNLNKKNNMIINGGVGSGNFNPGQGRGVGKPSNGSSDFNSLSDSEKFSKIREEAKWTKEEVGDCSGYFGHMGYTDIQAYLRGEDPSKFTDEECKKTIDGLTKKINNTKLKHDIVVYRGISIRKDRAENAMNNLFQSTGFQSTSLSENRAASAAEWNRVAREQKYGGNYVSIVLKINLKKGQNALASYTDGEQEIILPTDSKFRARNKDNIEAGKINTIEVDYER